MHKHIHTFKYNPSIYTRPAQHYTSSYTLHTPIHLNPISTLSYNTAAPLYIFEPCINSCSYHTFPHYPFFFLWTLLRQRITQALNHLFFSSTCSLFFSTLLFLYISTFLLLDLTSTAHDSCWPMQKAKSWGRTGVTTGNARKQQPSAAFLRRCTTQASTDGVRRRAIMVVCV